jgi:hypothetical protein
MAVPPPGQKSPTSEGVPALRRAVVIGVSHATWRAGLPKWPQDAGLLSRRIRPTLRGGARGALPSACDLQQVRLHSCRRDSSRSSEEFLARC